MCLVTYLALKFLVTVYTAFLCATRYHIHLLNLKLSLVNTQPEEEDLTPETPTKKKKKRTVLKAFLILFGLVLVASGVGGCWVYNQALAPNVDTEKEDYIIIIPTGTSVEILAQQLVQQKIIQDEDSFLRVAEFMNFTGRAGRFRIQGGWSNRRLINHLKAGQQEAVKLTFHNLRTLDEFAGHVSQFIEADSASLMQLFTSAEFLTRHQLKPESVLTLFLPDTYFVYWNSTPERFVERMLKAYHDFWTDERKAQAKALGLSPSKAYTLASIVEKETNYNPEKARIAGVYLNRLNTKGWLLQADPTVVFAVGDFSIRRVLKSHCEIDSPYNTYKYAGLPPGPIYMPSKTTLEATLNAEKHDYMFFCAKPDNSGAHAFAKTLSGHQVNARRYHRWLRQQDIR